MVAIFSARLLNGKAPVVTEDGEQTRDFVHVSDIVRANLLALRCPAEGGCVFNVGTGRPTTIRRIAELLADHLGVTISPLITGRFRSGDVRHCYPDLGLANAELGYEPRVQLEQGIGEVVDWVRTQPADDQLEQAVDELVRRGLAR